MNWLPTGGTEPLAVYEGLGTTGLGDLFVRVQRYSDSWFLDWADMTFKASGWTTLDKPLTEVDAVNAPGLYRVTGGLDTSAITNHTVGDTFVVTPRQSPPGSAVLPAPSELRIGQWVDAVAAGIHFAVAYDDTAAAERIMVSAWLVRDGRNVAAPTAITLTWRDEGGAAILTKTQADAEVTGPDAQGVFLLVTVAGALALTSKKAYTLDVSITDALGTVSVTRGVPTAG